MNESGRIPLPNIHEIVAPEAVFSECAFAAGSGPAPSCSTRLLLEPSLARMEAEAKFGTFDTGHYRMAYRVWGQGPALVFVPGMTEDSRSFVMPMARLSDKFCCVSYDLPTGQDDGASLANYRHADLVDDFLRLLDHLGIDRTFVLGCSFGSTIALSAMHREPQRLPRALMQGGFAHRPLATAEVLLASWARYWPWKLKYLPGQTWIMKQEHKETFSERESAVWDFFMEQNGEPPMAAVAYRALLLHNIDLRPILPTITQPILLICGEHDPLVGKECERDLMRGLPNVARAEIEGSGHMPHFTHPEVMSEVIEQFLGVKE